MQLSRSSSKDAPSPTSDRDASSTTRPSPSHETSSPAGPGSTGVQQQPLDLMILEPSPAGMNMYSNTPLVALSPAQPHLVAPGTPVATYSPSNGDWGHQYLQIASMTAAGFLSPAGHPVSPTRSPHEWPDVSPRDSEAWLKKGGKQTDEDPAAEDPEFRPAEAGRMVDTVLHAKSLTEQLLRDFSVEAAVDVLRTALSLLGRPVGAEASVDAQTLSGELGGEPSIVAANGSLPSVKLVHPDEFKNPSTFLKIYGDPLCFTRNGPLPKKGRNGNWECAQCSNVNFPRRFRCNMCGSTRHEEGDRVVSDYARQVYERYLFIYKHQQQMTTDRDSIGQGNVQSSQYSSRGGGGSNMVAGSNYGSQPPARNLHPMHPAHAASYSSKMMGRPPRQRRQNYGAGLIGQQPTMAYPSLMPSPHDPYMMPMTVNARPQDVYGYY